MIPMNKQEAIRSLQEMAQESFEIVKINAGTAESCGATNDI